MYDYTKSLKMLQDLFELSDLKMAKVLQVTETDYKKMLVGKKVPNLTMIVSAAFYFDVSCDFIVGIVMSQRGKKTPTNLGLK